MKLLAPEFFLRIRELSHTFYRMPASNPNYRDYLVQSNLI